jgi:hypothetical protein
VRLREGQALAGHQAPPQEKLGEASSQRSLGYPSHGTRPRGASKDTFPDHWTNQEDVAYVMAELVSSIPRRRDAIASLVIKVGLTRTKALRPYPCHFSARLGGRHKRPPEESSTTPSSAMDRHFNRSWTMSIL